MKTLAKILLAGTFGALSLSAPLIAYAGPYEDGMLLYELKNYAQAADLFKSQQTAATQSLSQILACFMKMVWACQNQCRRRLCGIKNQRAGYAPAQYNLAVLYEDGNGVSRSYEQAAKWYRKAADQGDAVAQNNLALLYDGGKGVAKSARQAAVGITKRLTKAMPMPI